MHYVERLDQLSPVVTTMRERYRWGHLIAPNQKDAPEDGLDIYHKHAVSDKQNDATPELQFLREVDGVKLPLAD